MFLSSKGDTNKKKQREAEEEEAKEEFHQSIQNNYKLRHPHLLDLNNWELDEDLVRACGPQGSEDERIKLMTPCLNSMLAPLDNLFTFKMLSDKTCKEIIEEVEHFESWCKSYHLAPERPNTMNNYGAILDNFGFKKPLDDLMINIINPLASVFYPRVGTLDNHHGFIVEYQIGKDTKLDFHVDDSEVTLNLCLGKQFLNGELYFGGVRCHLHQQTDPKQGEDVYVSHQPGIGLLHLGKHRHAARKISSGHRINLILWCRSSSFRNKQTQSCPDWCQYKS